MGCPGVTQKSNAIIRNFRNQENAYDLDNESHLIGKLRKRGIIGKFPRAKRRAP